jgi:hypothetical protein
MKNSSVIGNILFASMFSFALYNFAGKDKLPKLDARIKVDAC